MNIIFADQQAILNASDFIRNGRLVAVPTETVYGLAADAGNDKAVAKIFQTKGRPQFNPLIVHVTSIEQAEEYVSMTPLAKLLAEAFWPGPLTLVLPRKQSANLSYLVSAGLDTIAIRCSSHSVMRDLIFNSGCPIAAPSANPSNYMSPTTAEHVKNGFLGLPEPAIILDGGPCEVGLESTIVDACTEHAVILRHGGLSRGDLERTCPIYTHEPNQKIKAPGMLEKHYAPVHKIRLDVKEVRAGEVLLAFGSEGVPVCENTLNLSTSGDLTEAAANLFKMLHRLDAIQSSGIAVMNIPNTDLGEAINDRLNRASK